MAELLDDTPPSLLIVEEPFSDDVSDTVCHLYISYEGRISITD
jgi:hypothetical protein